MKALEKFKGLFQKNFVTVVMDGTDNSEVWEIISIIGMMDYPRNREMKVTILDESHPSIIAIQHKSTSGRYKELIEILDERFPGLCAYNVSV